jgi:hypothetical protein
MVGEPTRFHTLVSLLRSAHDRSNVPLAVAAMAFINVLVYGVEDLNFQVVLQHEFAVLGLAATMALLRPGSAVDVHKDVNEQLNAYAENYVDVPALVCRVIARRRMSLRLLRVVIAGCRGCWAR